MWETPYNGRSFYEDKQHESEGSIKVWNQALVFKWSNVLKTRLQWPHIFNTLGRLWVL